MLPPPSLVQAGIGGLAQGVELRFTTTVGEISLDISLCPPCHVSLGVYHTAAVYLLLCWHISTGASQNTRRRARLAFNTKCGGEMVQYAKFEKLQTKPKENQGWYLIAGERVCRRWSGGGGGDSLELVEGGQWEPGF